MKAITIRVGSFLLLICFLKTNAQRLYVGEKLPEVEFSQMRNYPGTGGKLSDFNGKFIILDFWNRFCSNCIAAFPRLQQVQEEHSKDIQIILITTDSISAFERVLKKSPVLPKIRLPIVLEDSLLSNSLFPHNSVPYDVWIDRNGKVIATTDAFEVNSKNINDLLAGKRLNVVQRNDIIGKEIYDELNNSSLSLLSVGKGIFSQTLRYYKSSPLQSNYYSLFMESGSEQSLRSLHLPFTPVEIKDSAGNIVGLRSFNKDVLSLFKLAYDVFYNSEVKRVMIEETTALEAEPDLNDEINHQQWFWRNCYSYEAVIPNYSQESFNAKLRDDLKNYFGVVGDIETRELPCLILYRTKNEKVESYASKYLNPKVEADLKYGTDSMFVFRNMEFGQFTSQLISANNNGPVILDETGIPGNSKINVILNVNNLKDITSIQKRLIKYGLGIRTEKRMIKVLVLKNVKKRNI